MNELIHEIEEYANAIGVSASTVLQRAINASGTDWSRIVNGGEVKDSTKKRIRDYIERNQPISEKAS